MFKQTFELPYWLKNDPLFKGKVWGVIAKNSGRKLVTHLDLAKILSAFQTQSDSGNYHALHVVSAIKSLRSTFFNSFYNTCAFTNQVKPIQGGRIKYQVHQGVVYLMDVEIIPKVDRRSKQAGFYTLKHNERDDTWAVDIGNKPTGINTSFAAVNGLTVSLDRAASVVGKLVSAGCTESSKLKTEGITLYYIPQDSAMQSLKGLPGIWRKVSGVAKMDMDAMNIGTAMAQAHRDKREVEWTVHENGTAPFVGGLRVLNQMQVNLQGKQSAYYINPTSNLIFADIIGRKVGLAASPRGSHTVKALSLRQSYLGGNLLGNVWMKASNTQGNAVDKVMAGLNEAKAGTLSLGLYTAVSLSALAAIHGNPTLMGSLALPNLKTMDMLGMLAFAGGSMGWVGTVAGALANIGYKRYDQNTKVDPFSSVFGKQL